MIERGEAPVRARLRRIAAGFYRPQELAKAMGDHLQAMELESDAAPSCTRFRRRTGLTCAAEFRGFRSKSSVEDAITDWLAERLPNAEAQVRDLYLGARPDIVLGYERDERGVDLCVIVEAKPIWHRWITTGERRYASAITDECGRTTDVATARNIEQLVGDRDKLVKLARDPRDRQLLLALVFQRQGEVDEQVVRAVGDGWEHHVHHVLDLCSPPGDTIGLSAMVFWPAGS